MHNEGRGPGYSEVRAVRSCRHAVGSRERELKGRGRWGENSERPVVKDGKEGPPEKGEGGTESTEREAVFIQARRRARQLARGSRRPARAMARAQPGREPVLRRQRSLPRAAPRIPLARQRRNAAGQRDHQLRPKRPPPLAGSRRGAWLGRGGMPLFSTRMSWEAGCGRQGSGEGECVCACVQALDNEGAGSGEGWAGMHTVQHAQRWPVQDAAVQGCGWPGALWPELASQAGSEAKAGKAGQRRGGRARGRAAAGGRAEPAGSAGGQRVGGLRLPRGRVHGCMGGWASHADAARCQGSAGAHRPPPHAAPRRPAPSPPAPRPPATGGALPASLPPAPSPPAALDRPGRLRRRRRLLLQLAQLRRGHLLLRRCLLHGHGPSVASGAHGAALAAPQVLLKGLGEAGGDDGHVDLALVLRGGGPVAPGYVSMCERHV